MSKITEKNSCTPVPVNASLFNSDCRLPYGLTTEHVLNAMTDFIDFIGFINRQLHTKEMQRLESFLMPANFSSIVGGFMNMSIPKYCSQLAKNQYRNGHPDLITACRPVEAGVEKMLQTLFAFDRRTGVPA